MAIAAFMAQQTGPQEWRLAFSSDDSAATFYLYRDGLLVGQTELGWWDVVVPTGEYPVLVVYDDADAASGPAHPGLVRLQWYRVSGVGHYRVDEQVSGVWTGRARLYQDGRGYYHWTSRWLEDVTSHAFRVVAVGVDGNEATAAELAVLMVRWPDPPDVSLSYSADTGKVTISAA